MTRGVGASQVRVGGEGERMGVKSETPTRSICSCPSQPRVKRVLLRLALVLHSAARRADTANMVNLEAVCDAALVTR